MLALVHEEIKKQPSNSAELEIFFSRLLDWSTKLCRYGTGASRESIAQTFYNQADLHTFTPRINQTTFPKAIDLLWARRFHMITLIQTHTNDMPFEKKALQASTHYSPP